MSWESFSVSTHQSTTHGRFSDIHSVVFGVLVICSIGLLVWLSQWHYLLYHVVVELVAITVAWAVFILGWNTRGTYTVTVDQAPTAVSPFVMLGIGYLFVGFLDLMHTVTYEGMHILPGTGVEETTQFWMTARFTETATLAAYPLFRRRDPPVVPAMIVFSASTALFVGSILVFPVFPDCFVPGHGLTPFKIIGEYVVIAILGLIAAVLWRNRKREDPVVLRYLLLSLVLTGFSEAAFTLYTDPFGTANMLGHVLKVMSFLCLYKAILVEGLSRPLHSLFRDLTVGQRDLEKRDVILTALVRLARTLADPGCSEQNRYLSALGMVGYATGTRQVCICKTAVDAGGAPYGIPLHTWSNPAYPPTDDDGGSSHPARRRIDLKPIWNDLTAGRVVYQDASDIDEGRTAPVVAIPIVLQETVWGGDPLGWFIPRTRLE